MFYIMDIMEHIVQVLTPLVMARLVVKLRIPLNLVVANNYYRKKPKKPWGFSLSSNTEFDSYLIT